jgi:xylan 1,4-beta-xylosidase
VNSTFAYYPGIPVFHSRDLAHWSLIGHVLDRPEQLNLDRQGVSRGLFAPAIRYNNGLFYVTCTLVDNGGNFVVTAKRAEGPWSLPVWQPEVNGIDPSLFFDDDGKAYLIYNSDAPDNKPAYDGHRTIRVRDFDARRLRVTGGETILFNGGVDITRKPVWIEGPYTPYTQNPILTQRNLDPARPFPITCTGHADFVEVPSGDWWSVFLGCRPYADDYYNTGRETFLAPVEWKNGWPRINPKFREIRYRYPLPIQTAPSVGRPYSGNFIIHMAGQVGLQELDVYVKREAPPVLSSGRQEMLENIINNYV